LLGARHRETEYCRRRPLDAVVAVLLVTMPISACSSVNSVQSSAASINQDIVALRALESPVLRSTKDATSRLLTGDTAAAADALEAIGAGGQKILDWLDAHHGFAIANSAATSCLRETMTDLSEQAERLVPLLRQGGASSDQLTKLRTDLGEAANCIQSSD
jgi:hypothetical protein